MPRFVGLYRELKENEHVVVEDCVLVPTIFIREVEFKKFLGSQKRDFPILCLMANVYLTNKRLLFLVLHEVEAVSLRKRGVPALMGIEGSWYEIPLTAITNVVAVRKEVRKEKELKDLIPYISNQEAISLTEISYRNERASGNLKEYIESIFDAEGMTKIFNLKNIVGMSDKIHMISEQAVGLVPKLKSLCGSTA